MLDPRWLIALALTNGWALWSHHLLLGLCTTFGLLISLSIVLTRRFSLHGVHYRRALERNRAQFGEAIDLTIEVVNLKVLPLTLLEVEDQLPRHLEVLGGTIRPAQASLLPSLYFGRLMLPYERVKRRLRVCCNRRGVHRFGPARWRSGDYLGAAAQHDSSLATDDLLVLPKVFPLRLQAFPFDAYIGADRARSRLLMDPLRPLGAREYVAGDPMRSIDWRTTARRSRLMVREFEPGATPLVQIILDFRIPEPRSDRFEPDEVEFAISVAASLAAHATQRGWQVGLCGNAGTRSGALLEVPPSNAPGQLATLLEALARANSHPEGTLADLLLHRRAWRRAGALVVVTANLDQRLSGILQRLHSSGHSVVVVLLAPEQRAVSLGGIALRHVPYEQGWARNEVLVLVA